VYLGSQTNHLSSSHRFPSTHNNPSTQLSSTQPVPPKRMDLHPSLPRSPSGSPSPFSRASSTAGPESQCWNSQDCSCEKNRAHANASQTCRPQVMAGLHQQPLQPTISWLIFNSSFPFTQPRHRWGWINEWVSECMKGCEGNNGTNAGVKERRANDQPHNQTRDGFKYFCGESRTSWPSPRSSRN
jgi:hypothetical protein